MDTEIETQTEEQVAPVAPALPPGSPLVQMINLLRGAQLFPNTEARVEIGNLPDGGFYVIVSGNQPDYENDGLKSALQLTFDDVGQLFDFGIIAHDVEGKLVCNNCEVQGDPQLAYGWTQDEFGDTCPLCVEVEPVGVHTAGVEAIAELVGAEKGKKPAKTASQFKQPPRPGKKAARQAMENLQHASRVKLPGMRK